MARHPYGTFWVPLMISVALLLVAFALPSSVPISRSSVVACTTVAVLLLILAGFVAYRTEVSAKRARGGPGGNANVAGNDSRGTGGRGGDSRGSNSGGAGGNANVRGNRSVARGGDGGKG